MIKPKLEQKEKYEAEFNKFANEFYGPLLQQYRKDNYDGFLRFYIAACESRIRNSQNIYAIVLGSESSENRVFCLEGNNQEITKVLKEKLGDNFKEITYINIDGLNGASGDILHSHLSKEIDKTNRKK